MTVRQWVNAEDEALVWVWASLLPGVRGMRKGEVLEAAGGPASCMALSRSGLEALGIQDAKVLSSWLSSDLREKAHQILHRAGREDIGILYPGHPKYSQFLAEIQEPPLALYWKGSHLPPDQTMDDCIAIVGSRRATGYGITMSERLSAGLSAEGYVVVSGLARGIDTAAHCGALSGGGRTVAVLGNGLSSIYPPENKALAERIMENGCLMSEYEPGLPPAPYHFPMRNRIISGLCGRVIVVEAGVRSGSILTVGTAQNQGRDVLVVPGNATSVCSEGCNRMIREGAELVASLEDVLESIRGVSATAVSSSLPQLHGEVRRRATRPGEGTSLLAQARRASRAFTDASRELRSPVGRTGTKAAKKAPLEIPGLDIPERIVVGRLRREDLTPDQIGAQAGLSPAEVQQVLLQLELKGVAAQGLDGRIRLCDEPGKR